MANIKGSAARRRSSALQAFFFSAGLLPALAACGGGGGGGGSSGTRVPSGTISRVFLGPAEYNFNYGLAAINASGAYATGRTGAGVKVAVIDSGIDVANPEFQGAIDPASTNIVTGDSADVQDQGGHGTAVAGVIRAARNGWDTHGVAYGATLLVVRSDIPGSCATRCSFANSDLANATNYAVANGAKVINYSLGGATPAPAFASALATASASAVLVLAAGNSAGADPIDPALSVAAAGQGIAVGAVDSTNTIASFSNRAGIAKDFFLVAPGVSIATTSIGGGASYWNGTSFSAPHVAAAAAVLYEAFPFMTPAQVVDALLRSARDLGDPGTDEIYGRGLVDLGAAMEPLGALSVPTGGSVSGPAADLGATGVRLGAAFGDALANAALLRQVAVLDMYGRPYGADLSDRVQRTASAPDLREWLRPARERAGVSVDLGGHAQVSLQTETRRTTAADSGDDPAASDGRFAIRAALGNGYEIGAARGRGLDAVLGFSGAAAGFAEAPIAGHAFASPFLTMAAQGEAMAVGAPLGPLTLRLGLASQSADPQGATAVAPTRTTVGEIGYTARNGAALKVQLGQLREAETLLESSGTGALALGAGARTGFVGLYGSAPLSSASEIVASFTTGLSAPGGSGDGLLRDVSTLRSDAFSLGVFTRGAFADADRLGFVLSQPLRTAAGAATLDVPVGRTLAGDVVRASERVGLVPSGREIDAEIQYAIAFGERQSLLLDLMLQLEPGHDADADPALVGGLRYRLQL